MDTQWAPDFFVGGAERCGTTTIYHYLSQSEKIFLPKTKEPCYFSQDTNESWRSAITTRSKYQALYDNATEHQLLGDASPTYLRSKEAPSLIKNINSHAKFVFILRDPIERAYSHFLLQQSTGREKRSFLELIELKKGDDTTSAGSLESSYYADGLKRYIDCFGPQRVRVIIFERFVVEPVSTIEGIFKFIGINNCQVSKLENHNTYTEPRGTLGKALLSSRLIHNIAKNFPQRFRAGVRNTIAARKGSKPGLPSEHRQAIKDLLTDDFNATKKLLNTYWNTDLTEWKAFESA